MKKGILTSEFWAVIIAAAMTLLDVEVPEELSAYVEIAQALGVAIMVAVYTIMRTRLKEIQPVELTVSEQHDPMLMG